MITNRTAGKIAKKIFIILVIIITLIYGKQASADTKNTNFENFTLGTVDGQNGWSSGGQPPSHTVYDSGVVLNTYGYPSFGTKSFRISNAITSSGFGNQTFSQSLSNEAGETAASTSTYSGGVRQPYFEAQWDFASADPGAEQVGLAMTASPDEGDGSRMSWIQMLDTPTGLQLNFIDYQDSLSDFVQTSIATSLSRTVPHTVKITMQFIDGPANDIVKIYLDGALIHIGTSWEGYARAAGGATNPVDSILFRLAGAAAPANLGKGFLIDNFSSFSGVGAPPAIIPPVTGGTATSTAVDLSSAGNFVVLSKTGITDTSSSTITGNVGTSPITGAAIGLTCAQVTGNIYSVDTSGPLPCRITNSSLLGTAVNNMVTAYNDATARTNPNDTDLYSGNIGGKTFAPGLHKWNTDVTIPTDVTLNGNSNDVWIFQVGGNLNIASGPSLSSGTKIILTGGAQPSNIFWQVGGTTGATLGTYSTFNGNILSAKQIILQTGALLHGRALAQTQVTLDSNTISISSTTTPPVITPPTPVEPITHTESKGGTSRPLTMVTTIQTTSQTVTNPGVTTNFETVINPGVTADSANHTTSIPSAHFETHLSQGNTSNNRNDVRRLQTLLATDKSIYPEGLITGYFGPLTYQAVGRLQVVNHIIDSDDSGFGIVGPLTRALLQKKFGY